MIVLVVFFIFFIEQFMFFMEIDYSVEIKIIINDIRNIGIFGEYQNVIQIVVEIDNLKFEFFIIMDVYVIVDFLLRKFLFYEFYIESL